MLVVVIQLLTFRVAMGQDADHGGRVAYNLTGGMDVCAFVLFVLL
jgi:hypothetical protein